MYTFICRWVWRNLALHHLLTSGSSVVNGCRQNESPKFKCLDGFFFFFFSCSFLFHKTLSDGLEWCGLLMNYCDVLISCLDSFWRHPFTAEDTLVNMWCNAKSLQICSDEETNSSTYWMSWEWVNMKKTKLHKIMKFHKISIYVLQKKESHRT